MLSGSISAIPYIECTFKDWIETGKIFLSLRKKGIMVPQTEALIAAVAIRENAYIFSLDKHFSNISLVTTLNLYQDNQY